MTPRRSGIATVTAFGDDGWGTLTPSTGSDASVPFHSTAIVDGTRTIEVGTLVHYRLEPGRQGRWEAAEVDPLVTT